MKDYQLVPSEVDALAVGLGTCLASDLIVTGGARVGYMYRERPDDEHDSGWRFFSGEETQEYLDDPANIGLYDVNTLANYDPTIIPFLKSPEGSAFERGPDGTFHHTNSP